MSVLVLVQDATPGKLVVSVSRDGEARLWRLATGQSERVLGNFGQVRLLLLLFLLPLQVLNCCLLLPAADSPFHHLAGEQAAMGVQEQEDGLSGMLLVVGGEEGLVVVLDLGTREEVRYSSYSGCHSC